jgi:hypothetical protein
MNTCKRSKECERLVGSLHQRDRALRTVLTMGANVSRATAQPPSSSAHPERAIISRTRGRRHGPTTRLMGPSDLGQLVKPFVFLDLFDTTESLLVSGQIIMRKVDGWQTLATQPSADRPLDVAA